MTEKLDRTLWEDNLRKIKDRIHCVKGITQTKITPESRMREDLKIMGDDAWEFLEYIIGEFATDLSAFNFDKYFPSEGELCSPMHYWRKYSGYYDKKYEVLTVKEIVDSTVEGKWVGKTNSKP